MTFSRSNSSSGCGKTFSVLAEKALPVDVAINVPVVTLARSAWTRSVVDFVTELIASQCTVSTVARALSKARVARYLRDVCRYHGHIK